MRSPPGEGTMETLKDVTERSRWSSDARTPIIPNPGECSPGIKPPGRREHENLAEEPAGLQQASPAAASNPQPGANPKLTLPRGHHSRVATRFHWGPREESCHRRRPRANEGQPAMRRASARGCAATELRRWARPMGPQPPFSTREHSGETAGAL